MDGFLKICMYIQDKMTLDKIIEEGLRTPDKPPRHPHYDILEVAPPTPHHRHLGLRPYARRRNVPY